MELLTIVCIYLGYTGDGYAVIALNDDSEYVLINLHSAYGENKPDDFFDTLPYGSICEVQLKRQRSQHSLGPLPDSGRVVSQYTYTYVGGKAREEFYSELTFSGEAFSVYNRSAGRRIQMKLDTIQGNRTVAGEDSSIRPDWFFLELENYSEISDEEYDQLYKTWKKCYDSGDQLNITLSITSRTEEFQNVWAPSGGSTIKNYWVIKGIEY